MKVLVALLAAVPACAFVGTRGATAAARGRALHGYVPSGMTAEQYKKLKDKEAAENMAQSKAQLKDVKADLFLAEKANEELVGNKTELACDLSVSRNIISNQNDELATLQTDAEQRADLFAQMQGILGRMAAIGPSGAATATP